MITKELLNELFEYRAGNLYRKRNSKKAGTVRPDGYCQIRVGNKFYLTHRLVFLMHYGYLPDLLDHIDNNPLNNHLDNLQVVTQRENITKSKKINRLLPSGVRLHKKTNRYQARIWLNKKEISLGYYDDIESASQAYQNKLKSLN